MIVILRNRLTWVWAFLSVITVVSWGVSRGAAFDINITVTLGVLVIAMLKAHLVMEYFMEVRTGPVWLKRACGTWVVALLVILVGVYVFV